MAAYYADSSVLVKRHVPEVGSVWFSALADPAAGNTIVTAQISLVEIYSALNRRVREAAIYPADYVNVIADLTSLWFSEYEIIELTQSVIDETRFLLERHPLRAYDAVQLASALHAHRVLPTAGFPTPVFLSADDRLLAAAQAEGLTTDNPNHHP
jgi:hypothetical protein